MAEDEDDDVVPAGDGLVALVRRMVDDKDAVKLSEYRDGDVRILELEVAQSDLGKVIGRQGRTVRALRTLLSVRGELDDERYELEIVED